jgi:hypothetical protein
MAMIDPEREQRRLAEFYSGQTDEELVKVAAEAYELTDLARQALRAEVAKRGLTAPVVEYASGDEVEMRPMVTVRKFRDLPEAMFAKGSLESAGIECALLDDNMVRLDWFISNLLGGVKLQVRPEDVAAAEEILAQPIPENLDVSGVGEYKQPRCPRCQSLDVSFQELNKPIAYVSAYLGVPLPVRRRAWRCHSCRAEWEDDGVPEANDSAS